MANEIVNKSMVFYESFYDATKDLPAERFREIWGALFEYAFYGEQPEGLSELATAIFKMAKPNIDVVVAKRSGGQKMGNPMGNPMGSKSKPKGSKSATIGSIGANHRVKGTDPMGNDPATIHIYDVDDDADVDVDVDADADSQTEESDEGSQSGTSAQPPTYQDVVDECRKGGYKVAIASKFFMFYDRSHWRTKEGEPVRDWRALLRIWNENEAEPKKQKSKNAFNNFDQRTYNEEDLEAQLVYLGGEDHEQLQNQGNH